MKKKTSYSILTVLILIAAGIIAFYRHTNKTNTAKDFIDKIREENKAGFDSLQNSINKENALYARIGEEINQNNFDSANLLINSLFADGKINLGHVYRGMLYAKQNNYSKAIEEYNTAIANDNYSLALTKRAMLYVKMHNYDLALNDYKKIYEFNYDYGRQIAEIFESKKMPDSALKYYQIFITHYPNNKTVQEKIKTLQMD